YRTACTAHVTRGISRGAAVVLHLSFSSSFPTRAGVLHWRMITYPGCRPALAFVAGYVFQIATAFFVPGRQQDSAQRDIVFLNVGSRRGRLLVGFDQCLA